ncbi:MAG: hypothetical protein JW751_28515 [Polyangiaceae bacterium]|nr:hypothetical protein [Polyangiaceae bacterium]
MTAPLVVATEDRLREIVREVVAAALADQRPSEPAPVLLRRADLARACSVSPRIVDSWRARGCPVVRVGSDPRFELAAVVEWLRAGGAT